MDAQKIILPILEKADVRINGDRPWDLQVRDRRLYGRVLRKGSLGLGEAYMDGWWECPALDELFRRLLAARAEAGLGWTLPEIWNRIQYAFFNLQSMRRAFQVAEKHYNLDNRMFERMLGPSMFYSCGYWRDARNLDEAQADKMALICAKLGVQPGMKVLDIGCGWGTLAGYLASRHKAEVTAVSVSAEQIAYAKAHSAGLPVNWVLDDYRNIVGSFDRIVSVGMFEHVGRKNYDTYMAEARRLLRPEGLFLLHTIGGNVDKNGVDPWIAKYIFPNGMLPSITAVGKSIASRFVMEDWHNFGAHYDKTLMAWEKNFSQGRTSRDFTCSSRGLRMFRYYLLSCAGAFRARSIELWQILLSPEGLPGGYDRRIHPDQAAARAFIRDRGGRSDRERQAA